MGIEAIIALVLTNLPGIIKAGTAVYEFVTQVRTAAQQNSQWTPALEQQYQDYLRSLATAPEQQQDKI